VNHLSPAEIEALVMDPQASPDEERREHLAACPDCALRLAEETRLELALHDAAAAETLGAVRQVAKALTPASWSRVALPAAAMLALVIAGLAFLALTRGRAPEPTGAPQTTEALCLRDPIALSPGYAVRLSAAPGADATTTTRTRMDWSGPAASQAATRDASWRR
jgi:hypothetical protein